MIECTSSLVEPQNSRVEALISTTSPMNALALRLVAFPSGRGPRSPRHPLSQSTRAAGRGSNRPRRSIGQTGSRGPWFLRRRGGLGARQRSSGRNRRAGRRLSPTLRTWDASRTSGRSRICLISSSALLPNFPMATLGSPPYRSRKRIGTLPSRRFGDLLSSTANPTLAREKDFGI